MVDGTTDVHHHIHAYATPGVYEQDDHDYVLYDDELWERLLAAQAALQAVEHEIYAKLVDEPLDEVEMDVGIEMRKMMDNVDDRVFDVDEWTRCASAW